MKKLKRCVIHVGTEKTGTTSIQESLYRNRSHLSESGIMFPRSFGEKNHVKLAICASRENRRVPFFERVLRSSGLTQEAYERKYIEKFRQECASTDCSTVVISNEHIQGQLHSLESKKRLRSIFEEIFEEIEILIYLRRQDELAVSLFTTRILAGDTNFERILPVKIDRGNFRFNYLNSIQGFIDVFGLDNVKVRLYSQREFFKSDLISDFYNAIGYSDFEKLESVPRENSSLNHVSQEYLALFNEAVPRFIDGRLNPEYGNIQEVLRKNFSGTGRLPSKAEAIDFYSKFKDDNERIREIFFPERATLFQEDFSKYPLEPMPFASKTELMDVSKVIWKEKRDAYIASNWKFKIFGRIIDLIVT